MTRPRTTEEWKTLRLTDADAYNLAIQVDEIEKNGGDPPVIDRKAAVSVSASPVPPQPDCYSKAEIDGRTQGVVRAVKETMVLVFEDIQRILGGKKAKKNGSIVAAAAAAFEPLEKRIGDLERRLSALDTRITAASINNRSLQ